MLTRQNFRDEILNASGVVQHYLHPPTTSRRYAAEETERPKWRNDPNSPNGVYGQDDHTTHGRDKQHNGTQARTPVVRTANDSRQGCLHHNQPARKKYLTLHHE